MRIYSNFWTKLDNVEQIFKSLKLLDEDMAFGSRIKIIWSEILLLEHWITLPSSLVSNWYKKEFELPVNGTTLWTFSEFLVSSFLFNAFKSLRFKTWFSCSFPVSGTSTAFEFLRTYSSELVKILKFFWMAQEEKSFLPPTD